MFTITKEFKFEAAHRVDGHPARCFNLHGHSYRVLVTLSAEELDGMEMVTDFSNLKAVAEPLFDSFDHAFLYNTSAKDPFEHELAAVCKKYHNRIVEWNQRFTAENMAKFFYDKLNSLLSNVEIPLHVAEVTVYETAKNCATYRA